MVANTRKMYELKLTIDEVLKYEDECLRLVEGLVEMQRLDLNKVDEMKKLTGGEEFLDGFILPIDSEELFQNRYLTDIKVGSNRNEKLFLSKKRIIRPNYVVCTGPDSRDENFMPIRKWGYFDQKVSLPAIWENGTSVCWMTVEPYEINTFAEFASSAKGRILLGGCGLGYIAYMLSLKDEVSEITIVEKDKNVIDLFENSILPQFENKDKIKIVEGDIIEYLKVADLSQFDEVNIDVWRDYVDMIYIYLPSLVVEHDNPQVKFSYWLEENLRYQVGKSILKAFTEKSDLNDILDIIGKYILDNAEVNNVNNLRNLIKLDNMRELLYNWYLDNVELTDKLGDKTSRELDKFMKMSREIFQGK